jgi:SAM-dependent methyltransferase
MTFSSSKNLYEKIWKEKIEQGYNTLVNRQREALKEIGSDHRFLDIGCGDGLFGFMVKSNYNYVYGIDGSETALRKMKNNGKGIPILANLDGCFLPVADRVMDLVTCLDVIEHVFDPKKLIKEAYRVLRINGVFILTTPNIRFIDHIRSILIKGRFPKTSQDEFCYDGGHINYFTFKDIRKLMEKIGFEIKLEKGFDEKKYRTIKTLLFRLFAKFFEKDSTKEFFCPGIFIKAVKSNE